MYHQAQGNLGWSEFMGRKRSEIAMLEFYRSNPKSAQC